MDEHYCFDIEFDTNDIDTAYDRGNNTPIAKTHHAHLYESHERIEIKVYFDVKTDLDKKLMEWTAKINWRKFGQYIKSSNATQNPRMLNLSFEKAQLKGVSSSSSNIEGQFNYFLINVDWVHIEWQANHEEHNTAEFYLNPAGFKVASSFYAPLFGFDNKFESQRRSEKYFKIDAVEYRPEFSFGYSDNSKSTEIKIMKAPFLKFKNVADEESIVKYANMVCSALSFFYQNNITYFFVRIRLPLKTVAIRKLLSPQVDYSANSLWHLNYHKPLEKYLESDWHIGFLQNREKLFKAIQNYVQAFQVDESSRYLLLYNILEVMMSGTANAEQKFTSALNEQEENKKYQEALTVLLTTIPETEHELFKDKWKGIKGKLTYKPQKSPLKELLISISLNPDNFPISIDRIKEIRDKLTHGSINSVKRDELEKATLLIYRITGILILNRMGISEWKLDTEIVI